MQELLDKSHVLMQNYTITRNTKDSSICRQIHVIKSQVGKTAKDVNDWIDENRKNIKEIIDITYLCQLADKGVTETTVNIDYVRTGYRIEEQDQINVEVKEFHPQIGETLERMNCWLLSNSDKIEVGGISIVNLDNDIAALVDYTPVEV